MKLNPSQEIERTENSKLEVIATPAEAGGSNLVLL
jgi:hypothetical protein